MSDINHGGNSLLGFLFTGGLFIIAKITVSDVAGIMTALSGLTAVLVNLPKMIELFRKHYYKYLRNKRKHNKNANR